MHAFLVEYLTSLRRRNLSERTIDTYRRILVQYTEAIDPVSAEPDLIEAWLDTHDFTSPSSRCSYVSTIGGFTRWAAEEHGIRDISSKLIRPKMHRRLPRPANTADLERAIAMAWPRMRAWLCLAAYQGLRCVEIAGLRSEDVVIGEGKAFLRLQVTKGMKSRTIPLGQITMKALCIPKKGPVFTDKRGRQLSAKDVSRKGNEYLHSLGISATMHQLRHWFGTSVYEQTKDLLMLAELMGHSNVATTAGYAKVVLDEHAYNAVESLGVGGNAA